MRYAKIEAKNISENYWIGLEKFIQKVPSTNASFNQVVLYCKKYAPVSVFIDIFRSLSWLEVKVY